MKLLTIIGNTAVGKMTVGQELSKITDLKLFHNHMTIEPVIEIFGEYDFNVIDRLRKVIFEEFAKSDNYGMIFTIMVAFDKKSNWDYVEDILNIFKAVKAELYFAELVSSQEIRLERNVSENRLKHKASKRDIELSCQRLLNDDKAARYESLDGEIPYENYIKIDNSNLPPETAAKMIKENFLL